MTDFSTWDDDQLIHSAGNVYDPNVFQNNQDIVSFIKVLAQRLDNSLERIDELEEYIGNVSTQIEELQSTDTSSALSALESLEYELSDLDSAIDKLTAIKDALSHQIESVTEEVQSLASVFDEIECIEVP